MYLKDKASGDLVEIMDMVQLVDPSSAQVTGRFHAGEELQESAAFAKGGLCFPSDEALPRCWLEPHYRDR